MRFALVGLACVVAAFGCSKDKKTPAADAGVVTADAGMEASDSGLSDSGLSDSGVADAGPPGTGIVLPPAEPVDVLFVVDNSGSMADEQDRLAAAFPAFLAALQPDADLHVAIVTTDLTSMNEQTGDLVSSFSSASPFQLLELNN